VALLPWESNPGGDGEMMSNPAPFKVYIALLQHRSRTPVSCALCGATVTPTGIDYALEESLELVCKPCADTEKALVYRLARNPAEK